KKQTDLREGVLHVAPADGEKSNVLVIRECDFHDGTIQFRFQLPHEDDQVGLVIADRHLENVHAGHVMNVWAQVGGIKVADMLHGTFAPEIYKRKQEGRLTREDKEQISAAGKRFPAQIRTGEWHSLSMTTAADLLTVSLDGKPVGKFSSPGFANRKTILRVSFRKFGAVDDFKLFVADDKTSLWSGAISDRQIDYEDPFEDEDQIGREFDRSRGIWSFDDGVASAVSTIERLNQHNRHGPIIKWPVDFKQGVIEFEMKPEDCQRFTFTLNGEGHVYRWVSTHRQPDSLFQSDRFDHVVLVWANPSSKTNKGDTFGARPLPEISTIQDQWTKVRLRIDGDVGTLQVGDSMHALTHPALERQKTDISISFGYGKLSLRNFRISLR
ncbi:MAG: hypothetical protein AAF989_09705, partial [Planctomycetota bacterium]